MSELKLAFEKLGGGKLTGAGGFGKPTLVVNTASECGYTPQYKELQALWRKYRDRGLVVLGVPCNDFGAQEPGDAPQIGTFCQKNYGVDFPLTAKVQIVSKGGRHPFYQSVADELGEDQLPRWNFHKYLVGKDGALLGSWPSKVSPEDKAITDAIDAAL
jgi:glutathione peroxidase